ncbi:hypothetical protein HUK65_14755 [Rhodobacteraceae bacterium 2376]|uniref:Uncharacterized protein n=1 Tax=Rhabdonatronobacter sediminivivens TaxID=2743469 RepID=A0A7Z0I1K6_9RHOB|nr:hypothetical protein [Rhabdonatronobacter sediminivivens]NYS26248.1 hypothetical protein [Rhabdonatronobacter sediminivivens]
MPTGSKAFLRQGLHFPEMLSIKISLAQAAHGHWRDNTFIAGLRSNRIDAPMLIEGAMDGIRHCA